MLKGEWFCTEIQKYLAGLKQELFADTQPKTVAAYFLYPQNEQLSVTWKNKSKSTMKTLHF